IYLVELCSWELCSWELEVVGSHLDRAPTSLAKTSHRQRASREVPKDDRHPDPGRLQLSGGLRVETQAERNRDLCDERDVERTARIARALQAAGVGQRHGDE